jgi:glycosyltransferase involved in cell wall biosynthesis
MRAMNTVSVVVPSYRRPALLARAVESALASAEGVIDPVVTVVDNASPEDVEGALRGRFGSRVRFLRNSCNLGAVGNWNRCREVANATGADAWLLLEDDNYLDPAFFRRTVATLRAMPQIDIVYTACREFDDFGNDRVWRPWSVTGGPLGEGPVPADQVLAWAFTCPARISGMLVRNRPSLRGVPCFDEETPSVPDLVGLCRLFLATDQTFFVDDPLMHYYVNPRSLTAQHRVNRRVVLSELFRAFNSNISSLVAKRRPTEAWAAAAAAAPVDRLLVSYLSSALHANELAYEVKPLLEDVLKSRAHQLLGWKSVMARLLGKTYWRLAAYRARLVAGHRRQDFRSADFDSGAARQLGRRE